MFGKLKQVKDLRKQAKEVQNKLSQIHGTGEAESGQISITLDGSHAIEEISIDKELLDPTNKSIIEEGVKTAHSKAVKKIQKVMAQQMRKGELEIPDLHV